MPSEPFQHFKAEGEVEMEKSEIFENLPSPEVANTNSVKRARIALTNIFGNFRFFDIVNLCKNE